MTDPTDPRTDPASPDDIERRLRDALATEAESIEPSPDGLARIEEKLMVPDISRNQKYVLSGIAAAIILIVGLVLIVGGNDDDSAVLTGTTSTTEATTTSTTAGDNPFDPTTDPAQVVFPAIDSSQRFDTPENVVQAFLRQYAGFTDPSVSEFRQGDNRSGEFEVTRNGSGPVSTILVRQLDDDTWGVIGAEHSGFTAEAPRPDAVVSSPVELAGRGLAFEGTINVDVREQGRTESIGEGFVTAGGTPPGSNYADSITFTPAATETGAIMYRELSAEDGTTSWVAITRVRFTPSGSDQPVATACGPSQTADPDEVLVFFSCSLTTGGFPETVAVARDDGGDAAVLRTAMLALLEGPTESEQARGLESPFPVPGSGASLNGVTVDAATRTATIDLNVDRADLLATGDTQFGMELVVQIELTAHQFPTVDTVEIRFNGSCDEFAGWAESDPGQCTL